MMLKKCHLAILWTLVTTALACPAMAGAAAPAAAINPQR